MHNRRERDLKISCMYNMYVRSFSIGVAVGPIKGREKKIYNSNLCRHEHF